MEYYVPPASGKSAAPSLLGKSTVTMGYGAGGGQPFRYYLRPEQQDDVGIIKFFISTEHVDLSNIKQSSPFDAGAAVPRPTDRVDRLPRPSWDTVTLMVIQHKPN